MLNRFYVHYRLRFRVKDARDEHAPGLVQTKMLTLILPEDFADTYPRSNNLSFVIQYEKQVFYLPKCQQGAPADCN